MSLIRNALVLVLLVCAGPALAQGEDVLLRPRPAYDPIGIPASGFRLFPAVDLDLLYESNVFRTSADTKADTLLQLAPQAALRSQWSRHALVLSGGASFIDYREQDSEDQTNWNVGLDARLDILSSSFLTGNASHRLTHEPRFSPDSPGFIAEPIRYSISSAGFGGSVKPNRFGIALGATVEQFNFDSTPTIGGGTLDNSDRDRNQIELYGRASYDFSPDYSAFIEITYDDRDFQRSFDRTGVNRDSSGYRVDGGISMMLARLVSGEFFAGYLHQDFKSPLTDISGFDFGADLSWYATELMTFRLGAAHLINDTTLGGASASVDRTVSAGLDYEVLRNLIAQGTLFYTKSDFHGHDRSDDSVAASLGVRYLVNRFMSAQLRYRYSQRYSSLDSPAFGQDFVDNTVMLGISLQD